MQTARLIEVLDKYETRQVEYFGPDFIRRNVYIKDLTVEQLNRIASLILRNHDGLLFKRVSLPAECLAELTRRCVENNSPIFE